MSSLKPPPTDIDPEAEADYVEEEDEDEDDFVPGEEEEDDDDDAEIVPLLQGVLSVDSDKILHYRGSSFHLSSTKSLEWDLLNGNEKPPSDPTTVEMEGPCDFENQNSEKHSHRKMDISWSQASDAPAAKGGFKDDGEGGDSKMPAVKYSVYGRQKDTKGDILELRGDFVPTGGSDATFVCQVRIVPGAPVAASAAAAAAPIAAAARVDDDDVEADADDEVDFDEIMDLHKDAGLTMGDLQQQYRGRRRGFQDEDDVSSKKPKSIPEDDEDDYAF